jgi:3-hydroxyisobutyrate dehydrogenase-like beta-hydroxyacid dehydrogenase
MSMHETCAPAETGHQRPAPEDAVVSSIGFVGFGEVAMRLAAALQRHGARVAAYDVLLDQPGGADRLQGRAGETPVSFLPLPDLLAQATVVLSTVTTDVALDAARTCAAHLDGRHVYVDLNATSPAVKRAVAEALAPSGAAFVEGAILGAIGVTGAQTRILVCGEKGEWVAEELSGLGLNVGFYGAEIGRASTFKLLRSVFSKGMEALLLEALLAARRAGVQEDIWREIVETLDERPFAEVGGNWMRTHGTAHARRYHEMVQVEALLRDLGIEPLVTGATTAFFERSTRLALSKAFQESPKSPEDVIGLMDDLLRKTHPSPSRGETA